MTWTGPSWSGRGRASACGFTLVEVLVALVLTVLVLAAVVPLSASLIERADERAVADRLSSGVRLAMAEAARSGAVVTLCARERRGLGSDLVLRLESVEPGQGGAGATAPALIDLGIDLPGDWRVETEDAGQDAGEPDDAGTVLTPVGAAMPDGRFSGLSVVTVRGERAARRARGPANEGVSTDAANGATALDDDAEPARRRVTVDALSGKVTIAAPVRRAGSSAQEPAQGPRDEFAPADVDGAGAGNDGGAREGGTP